MAQRLKPVERSLELSGAGKMWQDGRTCDDQLGPGRMLAKMDLAARVGLLVIQPPRVKVYLEKS